MKIAKLIFILIALTAFTGCVTRLGSFTTVSTKNIDWSRAKDFKRTTDNVTGEDLLHIIIIIPTKGNITFDEAVDNALNKIPGGIALIDAVVYYKYFYIPYIYGQSSYVIEGKALIDPSLVSAVSGKGEYLSVYSDDGKNYNSKQLTEAEYLSLQKELTKKNS